MSRPSQVLIRVLEVPFYHSEDKRRAVSILAAVWDQPLRRLGDTSP